MKHNKALILLPLTSLLLTGCFEKAINKEQFLEAVKNSQAVLESGEKVTNVRIRQGIQYSYDYKEGEFYRYHDFALILAETVIVWKEENKYYRYVNYTYTDKYNFDGEISKEQFDEYMGAGKKDLIKVLNNPLEKAGKIANNSDDAVTYDATFKYSSMDKQYTLKATGKSLTSEEEYQYTIKIKNNLPTEYKYNLNGSKSDTTWKYQYGKAELTKPTRE